MLSLRILCEMTVSECEPQGRDVYGVHEDELRGPDQRQ